MFQAIAARNFRWSLWDDLGELDRVVADRIERLHHLLQFLSVLALCHCCVVHTSQHGAYPWQQITGGAFAVPTNQLLVYMTMV